MDYSDFDIESWIAFFILNLCDFSRANNIWLDIIFIDGRPAKVM